MRSSTVPTARFLSSPKLTSSEVTPSDFSLLDSFHPQFLPDANLNHTTMETGTSQSTNSEKRPFSRSDVKVKAGAPGHSSPMATIDNDDDRLLARIGYKQVREQLNAL